MSEPLPSGVPPAELGLHLDQRPLRLPWVLARPEGEDADRVQALAPGSPRPAWWAGRFTVRGCHLAISYGAVSFNTQLLPLLQAAETANARCLVVLAPVVTGEALATALVNDLLRTLPGGIVPLRSTMSEYHVGEALEAIANCLGIEAWDGRPTTIQLASPHRLEADDTETKIWPTPPSITARATRWIRNEGRRRRASSAEC